MPKTSPGPGDLCPESQESGGCRSEGEGVGSGGRGVETTLHRHPRIDHEEGSRLKKEKVELERVKEDLTKQHTLELQSYKMQKAREIDQVSERVRAAVKIKDASIAQLKEELAKHQEQASFLLDFS
ncbi:hypothetical protein M758_2G058100 [Ceratodon purpureus]|nr:hypothetical protein M758_2G058100 [Ceratodon purpureus]